MESSIKFSSGIAHVLVGPERLGCAPVVWYLGFGKRLKLSPLFGDARRQNISTQEVESVSHPNMQESTIVAETQMSGSSSQGNYDYCY